ncbi:RNA polymerase sigma factor [Conexibacter sp. SYSU D00693]|uniref:RNA polymerase sigma factor n=1 Tax=Conexibacter sp. SYSU D00693 TaxID=2812560 RepID=UPI00196A801F|nr:RNA polymerase sigma factor [Conexibacter sp. SYSU D00693]
MSLTVDDISALYEAHARELRATLVRRTRDPELARDLVAETFAVAVEQRARFRGQTRQEQAAWLHGIARSLLHTAWRRRAAERRALARVGVETADPEFDDAEARADLERRRPALTAGLDGLDARQREAVQLRVVDQVGYREIAARQGVSEQVVRARVSRGLRRLAAVLAVGLAGVGLGVPLVLGDEGPAPSFLERAYAAVSGPGVVHWETDLQFFVDGRRTWQRQRTEGWQGGGVTRVRQFERHGRRFQLMADRRIAGGTQRAYLPTQDDVVTLPAPRGAVGGDGLPTGDPVRAFREAYREGRLRRVGPGRYRLALSGGVAATYTFDRTTARVRRIVFTTPGGRGAQGAPASRIEVTVTRYALLPDSAAARRALELRVPPSAGPVPMDAAAHFAVLRTGARPTAAERRAVELAARMRRRTPNTMAIDASGARRVGPGLLLVPGPQHVCLWQVDARGSGGTCRTTRNALRRGLSIGSPRTGTAVAVPDDVRAVRGPARARGRRATYAVRGNLARLPRVGGPLTLVR